MANLTLDQKGEETLNSGGEEHRNADEVASGLAEISVADLLAAVWQRRKWLIKFVGVGTAISLGLTLLAFFVPNEYSSTAQIMPPDSQMFSSISMLSLLSGPSLSSLEGGLFNAKSPGATVIGVLGSRTVEDDLIKRYNLRAVYGTKLDEETRKALARDSNFVEDKKTGIISITVTDEDRYRARNLAQGYVDELNLLANSLNTSSARRERVFLEQRLNAIKADLDASTHALSQFSSKNATFDPARQGEATVMAATRLQAELITAQSMLSELKAKYADDNVRVREAQARVDALQGQLQKMGGRAGTGDQASTGDQLLPSIRQLPLLGNTYYDLYRRVTVDQAIFETLTKQYELAKVQEAKEIPVVKVLDLPDVPERKSGPHRTYILIAGFLLSVIAGLARIATRTLWDATPATQPVKALALQIRQDLRNRRSKKAKEPAAGDALS